MFNRITLLFLLFLGAPAFTNAQDENIKDVKGTIRQIDLKTGNVTLQLVLSDKELPFSFAAKDLPVTNPIGDKLALADLRTDMRIFAKVRNDDEIVAVMVYGPYQIGTIKKADPAARSLIVKDGITEKKISIPEGVKIVSRDEEVGFDSFKSGEAVKILFGLDKKTILRVHIGKGISARDPYLRLTRYYGILADLDHAKRQATVFVQSSDAGVIRSHEIAPDAYLRLMYHQRPLDEVGIDQLAKWVKVFYFVDRDTRKIVAVDAELPIMIRRKVVKLDGLNLTVEDEQKERTLELTPDVRVWTPRGVGKLADVRPKAIVSCGLSPDRARVLVVYLWDR